MELDELRTRWQHPAPDTEPPLSANALTALLGQQSGGIIERLRKNARVELVVNVAMLVLLPALIYYLPSRRWQMAGAIMIPVCALSIYYFYRKLRLLRGLDVVEADMRAHLTNLVAGMRTLVRLYYRFTVGLVPVALLGGLLVGLFEPHVGPARAFSLGRLGIALAASLLFGGLLYWGAARCTRWYLQRLYGRHLDRLEKLLGELNKIIQ